ncbi:bifunctional 2-C-methyl-D-erythritol 4-phosphate cytidylyltransferase/2-C-methyl-D-erythritol 2,4-cyclodiphosphate synthase [Desulfovibrio litoralis]|uniref:Bifunctional enzyme IspD/IspF n=1 Tax=Desulfovibrio litoralis DSM 11393 TaxID=1121455 RepID=A0A1M7SQK2_9BACT|nr:bifunctional 2-C-methyl-D-erythritol 4-phosphate cytidylyltransferase/2-C-methyl-D-erythritol 2,4-cyclodiphosphate synthase [Desulfovibrio litoralis]SHN60732.1 2-C-methyl-D-erythritol 2,4-cyclodiphosphate synthase [Desulfovibrio litoralis DSM 11393]
MNNYWGIILAAGQGLRLQNDIKKQYLQLNNLPIFWNSALNLSKVPSLKGIVLVLPPHEEEFIFASNLVEELEAQNSLNLPYLKVKGGKERQDSVQAALNSLPHSCTHVLIHDSARPFASTSLANKIIQVLNDGGDAVIPGVKVSDTIKQIQENNGTIEVKQTPDRNLLRAVQTPQGFKLKELKDAHKKAKENNIIASDDATLMELEGFKVVIIEGETDNIKITTKSDLKYLSPQENKDEMRVAFGYDVHAYGGDRPLVLGGVLIPGSWQVKAHSDGDVLLHSLMDAILSCINAGDIGIMFPDNDPRYENISSGVLLSEVLELTEQKGLTLNFVDMTIVAQAPKLAPYRNQIVKNVSNLLNIPEHKINFKATTEEKLGFTGEKKGLKAVVCLTATLKA